jgi:type I protein arginine methyltransferase
LLNFTIKLEFTIPKATLIHGIACWFDTFFTGSNKEILLSTSPFENPTHWYQVRLLLPEPLAVNKNEKLIGEIKFEANSLQSYYLHLKVGIARSDIWIENTYDLKDPEFRGYTGYVNRSNQSSQSG